MKLFPVEDNDQQESYSRMSKYVRSLDPESDPFEETKLSIPDGYTMLPQMKNMDFQNQVQGNMNLPFKVFRPWKAKDKIDKNTLFSNWAENMDFINNAQGKSFDQENMDKSDDDQPLKSERIMNVSFLL